ncbi:MAG: ABC transporter ATP-binding protein [Spirochaetaceae bacterium]|jgi:NitT/TauT family transport system ATP-binding protein|nr:ABC transporter ATP-binding protein [Spirochaetaceae bacterium]
MNRPAVNLSIKNLTFGFGDAPLFENFSLDLGDESPAVILGPSGCGKTTLLKVLAGLLPESGSMGTGAARKKPEANRRRGGESLHVPPAVIEAAPSASFVFQESRLLPWMKALDNVILPIKRRMGTAEAESRARRFLDLAALGDKAGSFPGELSGGEKQRVSIARAFAFPAQAIFMDEPFQSLDIPLRLELMDMIKTLLETENRLVIAVTHDPREAVYLGKRVIVLGKPPGGIVLDEALSLTPGERAYGSPAHSRLEARLLAALSGNRRGGSSCLT